MSQNIRLHSRLFVFTDPANPPDTVLFDPISKTAFLFNFTYYGWIKSIALSLAGDIREDGHNIFSVHGACIDADGRGICLIGTSGAGKTTPRLTECSGNPGTRIVSEDWFFSRVYGPDILDFTSEKNFYIRQDLETIWKEFDGLVKDDRFDSEGRAIADIRWVIGKGRILPMITLRIIIVLIRNTGNRDTVWTLDPAETGLKLFCENRYFNPHLPVTSSYKEPILKQYVARLLERTTVYLVNTLVNTTGTVQDTQRLIRSLAGVPQKK